MNNKLNPCPFCGGEMRIIRVMLGESVFRCNKCGVTISFDMENLPESMSDVMAYFNSQTARPALK